MTVTSAGVVSDSMNLYAGDLERNIQAFSIFGFGTEPGQIPADRATEFFAILCSEPLKPGKS